MPVIMVANHKGGVGKSTIATNLAGYFARQGHPVMLGDTDKQHTSLTWLQLRPPQAPAIRSWDIGPNDTVRPPKGTTHVVLDTPAGLDGARLDAVMKLADHVLVPLQASLFDIYPTRAFITELHKRRKGEKVRIGVVGNRVREHTIAADQLRQFLDTLGVPVLGHLRDTQNYVHCAARGLTLWDIAPGRVERDLEQWAPILEWVER